MASYNHLQTASVSTWTIIHNLNTKFIALDIMRLTGGGIYEKIMPQSVEIINDNVVSVMFPITSPQSGRARLVAPNP